MKLNLRRKYKKRLPARIQGPLEQPEAPNVMWSMDFMHDGLISGESFRSFNIIDDYNREALLVTIGKSLTSLRVIRELEKLIEWRGKPDKLRVDNGPEFIAYAMEKWCDDRKIKLTFIQKGKPQQNGYIERFNRTYREEILDNYAFDNLHQARIMTEAWIWVYNNERPHSSLGYKSPRKYLLENGRTEEKGDLENAFPTFQQDNNNRWENIFLNATT
jgi:putative transposase